MFATNDPFYGGVTHLNDVIFAMPVFADGELIAWTANIAHWNDIGGMVPGSMSTEASRDRSSVGSGCRRSSCSTRGVAERRP